MQCEKSGGKKDRNKKNKKGKKQIGLFNTMADWARLRK